MKIVAGLLVKNEADRFLRLTLAQLLVYFHVVVLDDGSDDTTPDVLAEFACPELTVIRQDTSTFFTHEGNTRAELMRHVLAQNPDFIVCTDADELLTAPELMVQAAHDHHTSSQQGQLAAWTLNMREVWKADTNHMWLRVDGGWRGGRTPILYSVPERPLHVFRMKDAKLACGRQPEKINHMARTGRATALDADILHFGWTCENDRAARYQRYAVHDGGDFHAKRHIESIMWPDRQVRLARNQWPDSLAPYKDRLLARVNA